MNEPDDERSVRRNALWRIHGLAAILGTPFLLLAAVTGLMYACAPQIDYARDSAFDRVAPAAWQRLDQLVAAATAAAPAGTRLRHVVPPVVPGDTLHATFTPQSAPAPTSGAAHAGHGAGNAQPAADSRFGPRIPRGTIVHVDPGTGRVLGTQAELDRYSTWAKRLHSSLLQGDGWRWMIEWAATCLLVLLATGTALWWPRRGQAFAPTRGVRGRTAWKQWHAFAGFTLALMSLAIVLTGLTWSRYAGDQIRALRDAIGQAPPRAPQTLRSTPASGTSPLSWQAVWDEIRRDTPAVAVQIVPPRSADGVWRAFTPDDVSPTAKFDMAIDAYRGTRLFYADWKDQTVFSKATAIGIPFHRGEFGLWNQALLVLFGLSVLFSTVTGWIMWFRRRRGGWLGLVALSGRAWRAVPWRWPMLVATLLVCALVPLLLAFLVLLLAVEWRNARAAA
jgi:uncharacterized iron-regulated membrane protein